MKRTPISRGMVSMLLAVWLGFAASTVHAAEDTIKVGILHSLSGTMAHQRVRPQGHRADADRGPEHERADCSEGNWSRSSPTPRPIGTLLQKKPASC